MAAESFDRGRRVRELLQICVELVERRRSMTKFEVADCLGVHHRSAHRSLWVLFECGLAEPETFELHTKQSWQWSATPMLRERLGRR